MSEPQGPPLDPILTLQFGGESSLLSALGTPRSDASVTSVCFVGSSEQEVSQELSNQDSSDDSSDDEPLQLRSQQLVRQEARGVLPDATALARAAAASMSLSGRFLASCQTNGDSFLWDLGQRIRIHPFAPNRGPGLLLRRCQEDNLQSRVIYQTRDEAGTVSLHDVSQSDGQQVPVTSSVPTFSRTFCVAAPCQGDPHLVALPHEVESIAVVHDWRQSSQESPAFVLHGAGLNPTQDSPADLRQHGMITSLSLIQSSTCMRLACGFDSGFLFFHDLRMPRSNESISIESKSFVGKQLAKDPILSLDIATSTTSPDSFVAVAGLAGDAADQSESNDPGTIAIVKSGMKDGVLTEPKIRTKLTTCRLDSGGRPGVSICRFRPTDGRLFAVGGWDYRLRIFDRASNQPLALLRGHSASVQAMDWSSDASDSGLLATGGADGRIYIWRCFSRS